MEHNHYWFRAKPYGYGWDIPISWQGWLSMGVWLLLNIPCILWLARSPVADTPTITSLLTIAALAIAFIVLIWKTGEPAAWRWAGKIVPGRIFWEKSMPFALAYIGFVLAAILAAWAWSAR